MVIDLRDLLKALSEEEAEAQRALQAAQLRLANVRGQRHGVERVIAVINQQQQQRVAPTITEGEG